MKVNQISRVLFLPTMLLLLTTACQKEVANDGADRSSVSTMSRAKAETELLKALRNATAKFNSTTQAQKAGYLPDDHCVPNMGYHWANFDLVDPVFDPLKPEVMLYATGPGGNLRLVAVEYVVIDVGQDRPSFDGHLFDIGGTPVPAPHWSLHVWLYEPNPTGMFTAFNPKISCP